MGMGFEQYLPDSYLRRLVIGGYFVGAVVFTGDRYSGGRKCEKLTVVKILSNTLLTKYLGDLTWCMGVIYKCDEENRVMVFLLRTSYTKRDLERFHVSHSSSLPASAAVKIRSAR